VAVTGLGLVTPLGNTVDRTWQAMLAGQSGAGAITRFDPAALSVRFACEVKGFDPLLYMEKKEARRLDLFAQFGLGAAVQAVTDACLDATRTPLDKSRVGVIIGTGTGGIATFEQNMRAYFEKGPSRVSPFFVPMFMANVASALVSMRYGYQGPNYCTVSACATSGHSLGEAFRTIQRGDADVMISGGAEAAITPLAVASFANMKALSERNDHPAAASRPFDKDRDGFVMGDGAGIVVLEEWEHAQRRGARIYAEIVGYGMTADAYHITAPAPDGRGAQQAMRLALADGNLAPGDVDYINAHGTSTPHGDAAKHFLLLAEGSFHRIQRDRADDEQRHGTSWERRAGLKTQGVGTDGSSAFRSSSVKKSPPPKKKSRPAIRRWVAVSRCWALRMSSMPAMTKRCSKAWARSVARSRG
jgi:3-oxoacyl-[acyl-carrier-protein] synthase II